MARTPIRRHRNDPLYWAFIVHRLSGLGLALFLPLHFLVLGMALEGRAPFDLVLMWTDQPLVKAAEFGLVLLLGIHFLGGLRLLALELLPWSPEQKTLAAGAAAGAFVIAGVFLLNAI